MHGASTPCNADLWCCRFGAVLADEMGLGKTLQVIALLWTLIKQGPQVRLPLQCSNFSYKPDQGAAPYLHMHVCDVSCKPPSGTFIEFLWTASRQKVFKTEAAVPGSGTGVVTHDTKYLNKLIA